MYPDASKAMKHDETLGKPTVPNLQVVRKHLVDQGIIGRAELMKLIMDVTKVMGKVPHGHLLF
jgi:hypothetical protein